MKKRGGIGASERDGANKRGKRKEKGTSGQ